MQHASSVEQRVRRPRVVDFARAQEGPEIAGRRQIGIQQVAAHQPRVPSLEGDCELVGVPGDPPILRAWALKCLKVEYDRTGGHAERRPASALRGVLGRGRRRSALSARLGRRALAGPMRGHHGWCHPVRGDPTERLFDRVETVRSGGEETPEQLCRLVAHLDLHSDEVGQLGNLVLKLRDAFEHVRERQRDTLVELRRQAGLRLAPTSSADGRHGSIVSFGALALRSSLPGPAPARW